MFGIALVRCLSEETDDTKDALAKLFFKLSDKNQSNGVDQEELKQFLKFISSFDLTMKKKIAEEETVDDLSLKNEFELTLKEVFDKFDLEKKGFLNVQEFAKFFNFYL